MQRRPIQPLLLLSHDKAFGRCPARDRGLAAPVDLHPRRPAVAQGTAALWRLRPPKPQRVAHTVIHPSTRTTTRSSIMRIIATAVFSALFSALPVSAATLEVSVEDISVQEGELLLALYDSEAAWKGEGKRLAGHVGKPDGSGSLKFSFEDLPPGRYAVRVMHDENGNGKLDSNMLGIPKEGYGASNNPRVMRAPHFDEAAFEVGEQDLSISISLN
jgi:uncharacterized protein (DUF2141 family)